MDTKESIDARVTVALRALRDPKVQARLQAEQTRKTEERDSMQLEAIKYVASVLGGYLTQSGIAELVRLNGTPLRLMNFNDKSSRDVYFNVELGTNGQLQLVRVEGMTHGVAKPTTPLWAAVGYVDSRWVVPWHQVSNLDFDKLQRDVNERTQSEVASYLSRIEENLAGQR